MKELIVLEEGVTTVELGPTEHKLFVMLAQEPYRCFGHEELWLSVWGFIPCAGSCAQSQAAHTLRKKLRAVGVDAVYAHRGTGYSLRRRQKAWPSSEVARRRRNRHALTTNA